MAAYIEKKFQSSNAVLSVTEYPGSYLTDFSIESQDDGGLLSFELESKEQLDSIIQHLLAVRDRWQTPIADISAQAPE